MAHKPRNRNRARWDIVDQHRVGVQRPAPRPLGPAFDPAAKLSGDLLYVNAEPEVLARFPHASVADASDFIHEDRISVDGLAGTVEDWFLFLIEEGLTSLSFRFQLDAMSDPAGVLAWLHRTKKPTVAA